MSISRWMDLKLTAEGAERGRLETQRKLDAAQSELAALREELAKAKADSNRLQFWQDHPVYFGGFAPSKSWSFFNAIGKTCYGDSLRDALDQLQVMDADLNKPTESGASE